MSLKARIEAADRLTQEMKLENSRISEATWLGMSPLPQKMLTQVDEDLIKEYNAQFPNEVMRPAEGLDLQAPLEVPPRLRDNQVRFDAERDHIADQIIGANQALKEIQAAKKQNRNERNNLGKSAGDYKRTLKAIEEEEKRIKIDIALMKSRLRSIDSNIEDNEAQISEIGAQNANISNENKLSIETYRQEMNLLNKTGNLQPQQPGESEEDYLNRLHNDAEIRTPSETVYDAKLMINRKFREKMKELIRSDVKIDLIANSLDDRNDVTNKDAVIKMWPLYKAKFLKIFGENTSSLEIENILGFTHNFLGNSPPEAGPDARAEARDDAENEVINPLGGLFRLEDPEAELDQIRVSKDDPYTLEIKKLGNPSVYFRVLESAKREPIPIYSFSNREGTFFQYIDSQMPRGEPKSQELIKSHTGIKPSELSQILTLHPSIIGKKLLQEQQIQYTPSNQKERAYFNRNGNKKKMVGWGAESFPVSCHFGKLMLRPRKLYLENVLSIKWRNGTNVAHFSNVKVSEDLVQLILNMVRGEKPTKMDVQNLSSKERQLYDRLISVSALHKEQVHTMPKTTNDLKKKLALIEGEISAGNNNPQLLDDLKTILYHLEHLGCLTKLQIKQYLAQF